MPVKVIAESFHPMTLYSTIKGATKLVEYVAPDELRRRTEKHMGEAH